VEFEMRAEVRVEFCQGCKGMLLDEETLQALTGVGDVRTLTESFEIAGGDARLGPCLRCNTVSWQRRRVTTHADGLAACEACAMVWLWPGALEQLRASSISERRRARAPVSSVSVERPSASEPIELGELADPADRISFERGLGNVLGVPVALALSLPVCMSPFGGFLAGLIGMPFHELGHALASWLSSRFALPLPFFTIWHDEQSLWFGLGVAGLLGWFGYHSWREEARFGLGVALTLLSLQLGLSWMVPARSTLMVQILGGALGELVLGALLLAAFHFPLPDRLRWDFWRWPALLPGAFCFTHALLLWARAAGDARHLPWGSALGNDSDGDMNRLVRDFGWSAAGLAAFYLKAGAVSALGLVGAHALALRRYRLQRRAGRG
jgi:hypothetical protein